MNFKNAVLIFALVVQVKSDCDDYFKCLSGFVGSYISGNVNNTDDNNSTDINSDDLRNASVNYFDLSHIGKSLSQALTDVTTLIKDEIKGLFNIDDQIDVPKDIKNKTEIYVRAFSLSKVQNNDTEERVIKETNATQKVPEIILNNLTKFNEELNALKVEIENNLQAELESFISQVLENDTVDWIELTEKSMTEAELSKTEIPYPDFDNEVEITTENLLDNITYTLNDSYINEFNKYSDKISIVLNNKQLKDPSKIIYSKTNIDDKKITTTPQPFVSKTETSKRGKTISTTPIALTTSTKSKVQSKSKQNVKNIKSNIVTITSSTELPKTNPKNVTIVLNNDTTTPKTVKSVLTKKPKKQELQTKTSSNYKHTENIKDNEISHEEPSYYDIQDDNVTDYPIIDYVDLYKDTTNEDIDYVPTVIPTNETKSDLDNLIQNADELSNKDNGFYTNDTNNPISIFPWIAAIFIKNSTNDQFDYYCDGTILSNSVILTAARCLLRTNVTVDAQDVIVIMGKSSLQVSREGESIHKVKQVKLHSNFSLHGVENDLAVLLLEDPAVFSEEIKPACLIGDGEGGNTVTTAWSNRLSLINFEKNNETCGGNPIENTFCATYGLTVALCPSFGGAYAAQQAAGWCVVGLRSADPTARGLCFDKTVRYTDLRGHREWLQSVMTN